MTRLSELLAEATNPKAYDADNVNWEQENGLGSSRQELYREYFNHPESWRDKAVLDVGCGTGWLCNFYKEDGAHSVTGIEPSEKNLDYAQAHFKNIEFVWSDLLSFESIHTYDLVSAVMVLMNIESMDTAFRQLSKLTKTAGELLIVVPDYDYFKMPRNGYEIEIEHINEDEYVERTKRPQFTVSDIIRKNGVYKVAALSTGFKLIDEIPLLPTDNFRKDLLQYDEFKGKPIMHLMRFKKEAAV